MEHRQRPQIDRVLGHRAGDDITDREQMRAAVMIDDAFGVAGGARRVVERDRVPFVVRHFPGVGGVALRDEVLVFDFSQPLAGAAILGIVVVDHQRFCFAEAQGLLHYL